MDRQLVPEGLAQMPPGPELAAVLADVDLSRLNGFDAVVVLQAQARQVAHYQAGMLATMAEIAHCPPGPADGPVRRLARPDPDAADEIAMALTLTRVGGQYWWHTATDLLGRLPRVHAALAAGDIDLAKATMFAEQTATVDDALARAAVATLIDVAPQLTRPRLREKLRRMLVVADPDRAAKRRARAAADRRVVGEAGRDGTAMLAGFDLPVERVAAACERLSAIARAAKARGDVRSVDQLRADVFLDLLEGRDPGPAQARAGVVEVTVPLTSLLGLSQEPGVLAGWGPVIADVARQIADRQARRAGGRWLVSVLDGEAGPVTYHGALRRRPTRMQADRIAARDRRCRAPGCRVPARSCQDDHTREYQHGGPTVEANLGNLCAAHHSLKTHGKTRLTQPAPGQFTWTTALGHTHHTGPEPPYG